MKSNNMGAGNIIRNILSQLSWMILALALQGCVVEDKKDVAPATADPVAVVPTDDSPVPSINELRGTFNPKMDAQQNMYWCTEFGGKFVCQATQNTPSACTWHWPNMNGQSVMGAGIGFMGNNILAISVWDQTMTYSGEQVSLSPANVSWSIHIESSSEIYLSYYPGCTLVFKK